MSTLSLFPEPVRARLSARCSVEIAVDRAGVKVIWDPAMPSHLTFDELARYRRARARLMRAVARRNGMVLIQSGDVFGFVDPHSRNAAA
jgi:hypothetical protein